MSVDASPSEVKRLQRENEWTVVGNYNCGPGKPAKPCKEKEQNPLHVPRPIKREMARG